ncbi:bone morphogenetic protein receptor type-2 isoform X1 [Pleuronectes platessa]|uniref:bone morphogenetic protein receptor type-2 isoform X1 n=2 Tax=Pleuronectes platessa TaxID=8262 RepID=UPI00232A40F9|nr:bone morphogenetic protein receptor type-2 isoform X1 [Pleuronectes platessa]XP_053295075.1 bone morphogenetic protein receptor type-2 isoform X1 [Pleuronectes platessa]
MAAPVALCVCVLLLLPAATALQSEDIECAFTDNLQGAGPHNGPTNELRGVVRENGTILCSRGSRCYGLWEKQADSEMHLVNQDSFPSGCWAGDQQECHGERCLVTTGSYRFCCCSRDLCNANFTEAPPTAAPPALRLMKSGDRQTDQLTPEETALVALVTVAIAAILIMALFLGYRMMRGRQKQALDALDALEAVNTESVDLDNLKLLQLIGRGRYGVVFRGSLNERCVAVKVFSSANRQNFANECSIYCLPLLQQHDNISRFLTADERTTADGQTELLIVMEYYPHGCLSHFLSVHTVDWLTCCRMCQGVTRGLSFLHTELYRADQYKPAVAHRDVTSRNVLVRADRSCVLADFGLSMRLTGHRPCRPGDDDTVAISEVGTVRYMAPEVLGGALNLRDCESALKQVDVYALGLLYWESFRRCSDLFPGETAPEHQLAFQAELGNHPSFDEMQILVVREKHRPRFPDAWKDNSPVLRSLKETMEDCWDQDAEARLTAQCAEERLTELTLLSTHTAIHNNRNLSPRVGSASFHIEDLQVGVVKNLQGDPHLPSVVKATTSGAEERNRKLINYERQKSQARLSSLDAPPSLMPATVPESELRRGTVSVCLQLTEEDLDATKLDPRKVDKNLRENSDENLMEHSQKQFSSHPQITNLLSPAPQTNQVNNSVSTHHGELGGVDAPPSSSIQPLPKQQNLPKRPTSLHLLPKTMETLSASSRRKLEKLKSNHRQNHFLFQVEMGVAKMNTVPVATAAEPHLVTTVTNTSSTRGSVGNLVQSITLAASRYSGGVPSLLTNSMVPGGRTNPAGPRLEDEDSVEEGTITREDTHLNLLNFSPDEDEPLLRRGQPPDKSRDLPHQSRASGRGSNSNNNNNRTVVGAEVKIQDPEVPAERMKGSEVVQVRDLISPKPEQINGAPATQAQDPAPKLPTLSNVLGVETQTDAEDPASDPAPESQDLETTAPNEASDPEPTSIDQKEQTRTSRPERPCSLDLSFPSSDDVSLTDNVSASGEKIKRRVKTPYTLKRWRPASWVVTTDTALDPDFGFDSDGVNVRTHVSPSRARRLPKLSQSRSSMAVFWVGCGATSDPDGMSSF